MAQRRSRPGSVVVDLQAVQSSTSRGRGIGKYAVAWANALERVDPDLVSAYLLAPDLAPPGDLGELVASGKVTYRGAHPRAANVSLFHSLSPLDTARRATATWPEEYSGRGIIRCAMVYDVIPGLDPDVELADPVARLRYRRALELVRGADALQTLAVSVAHDLGLLRVAPRYGIDVIGAAPDARFVPAADRISAASEVAVAASCSPRFIYVPTGSHPRKNNERVVAAFASLPPEVRGNRQLLLSGAIDRPTRVHYDAIADGAGASGSIVVAGYLSDELQLRCFQGAELVCFGSLKEGFGLPIIEAYACETPVIASDRVPFNALVPKERLFDPTDVPAITRAIASALADPATHAAPLHRSDTWADVAGRSIEAFSRQLAHRSPRPIRSLSRRKRPRLAFVSPLPPAPTGVAGYSAKLVDRIIATGKVEVDLYWDGPTPPAPGWDATPVRHVNALRGVEALTGRYDHVVFTLGNSHHHLGALEALLTHGGTVLAHDVRLSNLYRHRHGDPGRAPHGLERTIRAMYGEGVPDGLGHNGEISQADVEQHGILMAREAIAASDLFLVTSGRALGLARLEARTADVAKLAPIRFAVATPDLGATFESNERPAPEGLDAVTAASWGSAPEGRRATLIVGFGIVDPTKSPAVLIDAVGGFAATRSDVVLALVGPVADALAVELADHANAVGLGGRFILTGSVDPERYAQWMGSATVAVQLRSSSNGEASATIGECLALGVPTIASGVGWTAELPTGTVAVVPRDVDAGSLVDAIGDLLDDRSRRRALRDAGLDFAAHHTFDQAARELLAVLEGRSTAGSQVVRSAS